MSNLGDEFKSLMNHERPDSSLLVPLLIWTSGNKNDIELCQKINKRFFYVSAKVLVGELAFNISLNHIIPYPKVGKEDEKLAFFHSDIAKYFGWTPRELKKNISVIDETELAPIIAVAFGYDDKQRKLVGLKKQKF